MAQFARILACVGRYRPCRRRYLNHMCRGGWVIENPLGVKCSHGRDVDRGCIMQGDELGGFDDGGSKAELVSERERIMRSFRSCVLSRNFHSRDVHPLHGGTPAVPGDPDASEGLHVRNGGHFGCLKLRLRLLET